MQEALVPVFFLTQWRPVPPVISQGMMAVFTISLSKLLIDVGNFILTVDRTIPRQRKDSTKL